MKRRYFRDNLSAFNPRHDTPSWTATKGLCACGVETSRMGYSSAEPWQCRECAENALRATFDRAMKTKADV